MQVKILGQQHGAAVRQRLAGGKRQVGRAGSFCLGRIAAGGQYLRGFAAGLRAPSCPNA